MADTHIRVTLDLNPKGEDDDRKQIYKVLNDPKIQRKLADYVTAVLLSDSSHKAEARAAGAHHCFANHEPCSYCRNGLSGQYAENDLRTK